MKLFGTDGIRGKVNKYPVTAEVALDLGKAFATFLASSNADGKAKVVIGRDTRESGSMLEEALIAGVAASGADAVPLGVVPSNAVSALMHDFECNGGVMVTASHNPAGENGMKFFSGKGFKLSEEEEGKIEGIFFSKKFASPNDPGTVFRARDVKQRYISFIKDSLEGLDLEGLEIGVDTGNGSMSYIAKDLFFELKASAEIINSEPSGSNINDGCGALFPQQLQQLVRERKLDAGIAFDGDADRLVMVDETGKVLDGDALIAIAAFRMHSEGHLKGGKVVVTSYSNTGLVEALKKSGIKVEFVQTGDKFVTKALFEQGLSLGGESSGHIILPKYSKTADAALAACHILAAVKVREKKLSELASVFAKYPQAMVNVAVREKKPIESMQPVAAAISEAEKKLKGYGRVFVRYSGTESKLRILVEGKSEKEINDYANSIAEAVKKEIGE